MSRIQHKSHPHLLKLRRTGVLFICAGCKEMGIDECYHCKDCHFYMHKECARRSSPAYHPLFEGCEFKFRERCNDRVCDGCGKDVEGFVYRSRQSSHHDRLYLHPCCLKLQRKITGEEVTVRLKKKASSRCCKCQNWCDPRKGPKGWCYVSSSEKYCFHVACVKEMIYEAWEKDYFHRPQGGADCPTSTKHLALNPSNIAEILRHEGQSNKGGKKSGKWRTAIKVLTLIIRLFLKIQSPGLLLLS